MVSAQVLLATVTVTCVGCVCATFLYIFGPSGASSAAALLAFLGPVIGLLLVVIKKQVDSHNQMNSRMDELIKAKETIAQQKGRDEKT